MKVFTTATDNIPSKIGQNFLWMAWSGVVTIANSVLIWVFLARMRDVDEVGRFTIAMGLYALFFGIVSLGLLPYLTNEIARRNASHDNLSVTPFISSASVFLALSGVLSTVVMTAAGFIVSGSWTVRASTAALSLAMLPTALIVVAEAAAIANGRARLVAAVSTIENILRTVVPVWLIWAGYDIVIVCLFFAAVRFVALAVYFIAYRSRIAGFVFSSIEFRALASICPTFAATITVASLNWQAPVILLGYLASEIQSASFGVASRFLIPVSILMAAYANAIQPALVAKLKLSPERFGSYLSGLAAYPLLAAALGALGSIFLSQQVLGAMFGDGYGSAAPVLEILAISTLPFCLVMTVARALIAAGAQRIDLFANVLGIVVCACAGVALIPRYGAVGAAAAQMLSFTAMAFVEIVYLARKIESFRFWQPASVSSAGVILVCLILWNR